MRQQLVLPSVMPDCQALLSDDLGWILGKGKFPLAGVSLLRISPVMRGVASGYMHANMNPIY